MHTRTPTEIDLTLRSRCTDWTAGHRTRDEQIADDLAYLRDSLHDLGARLAQWADDGGTISTDIFRELIADFINPGLQAAASALDRIGR